MDIDKKIIAKQHELKVNNTWIATHPLDYDPTATEPHPSLSQEEINEHIMHVKTDELLEIEYELLLDEKYPGSFLPDRESAMKHVEKIKAEIEKLKHTLNA